jgi:tetratricopeptide (TPR) repeat protein
MLREFCVAVEALSNDRPMVLWLEDLHWGDPATVDLLGMLARRRDPARLLVLGTYRPVDAAMRENPIAPLKRDLVQQGVGRELSVEPLDEAGAAGFVAERFGDLGDDGELTRDLLDHTDGNPLFLVAMTDLMVSRDWLKRVDDGWELAVSPKSIHNELPESLRGIVEGRLEGMADEEVAVVEAASVVSESFASGTVAMVLGMEGEASEAVCDRLARWGGVIRSIDASRQLDGQESPGFEFLHQVFRRILYDRIPPARRRRFHLNLALGFEKADAELLYAGAAEIAVHFERGGDTSRAIKYLERAADGLRRRFAGREAAGYLDHALDLLAALPDSQERAHREVELRHRLARTLIHAGGDTAERQIVNIGRALDLGRMLGEPKYQLVSLSFQTSANIRAGEFNRVRDLVEDSRKLVADVDDPVLQNHFRAVAGVEAAFRGDHERASGEFAACNAGLEGVDPREFAIVSPVDFVVFNLVVSGWSAWLTGRPDEAQRWVRSACERAEDSRTGPFGMLAVLPMVAIVELCRRDRDVVEDYRRSFVSRIAEFGFPWPFASFSAIEGWLLVQAGDTEAGIKRLRNGVAQARAFGTLQAMSLLLATLAEAELAADRAGEGIDVLDEAMEFVGRTGERFWEAEIHRLRGDLLRLDGDDQAAEKSFRKSLGVSRRQGALSLELRGAMSLARLLRDSDRRSEGKTLLTEVFDRFEEGFDTLDLIEAKELLEEL